VEGEVSVFEFLSGATAMGCLVAAGFFLRFWRETRDRLFLFFAIAFAIMAVSRTLLSLMHLSAENEPYLYLLRLAAFVVIAFAIVDKNRQR
jgi:low temperature requirement protein LtrA